MLTDGVEDASIAMYENVDGLSLNSCFDTDEKESCVSMSGSRTRFSKCSMSGNPYFVDVELTQIKKAKLYRAMFS